MSKSYIDLINSIQRKIDIAQKEADIKDIIKKQFVVTLQKLVFLV